jgi:hypothetical protein
MDECGFDFRDFLLLYGYSEKGERFHTEEKLGRGERINSLASMWIGGCFDANFFCTRYQSHLPRTLLASRKSDW